MAVRKALENEAYKAEEIYKLAREFMRKNGNPDQWGEDYPCTEQIKEDIQRGEIYFLEEEGEIQAVFALFEKGDFVYDKIDGKWLNEEPYIAVHRVASAGKTHGILGKILDYCNTVCENIKIDTYKDNIIMQNALKKEGFSQCGTVKADGKRDFLAFQRAKKQEKTEKFPKI